MGRWGQRGMWGQQEVPDDSQTSAKPAPPKVQPPSTKSGVGAASATTGIFKGTTRVFQCIHGEKDQGRDISFVQRYLRNLRCSEVTALRSVGLKIVSCYEEANQKGIWPKTAAYFTREQGRHDGRRGFTQAQAVGQPEGTPVYFAVDFDADDKVKARILDYFRGISEGRTLYLADMRRLNLLPVSYSIGVYGGSCVLEWCQAQGVATSFWQAFANAWCGKGNRDVWFGANLRTSGLDTPNRCGMSLDHLEGWGSEGSW